MCKKWFCAALCILMLFSLPMSVFAEETKEEEKVYRIQNRKDFLEFTERCRLDSYSFDLVVSLEKDIDLTDVEFVGVPIFCGTFRGNGHTIRGLVLKGEGSHQGLFRYIAKTARVEDLHIEGQLIPEGSGSKIGALAGKNEGQILKCSFSGTVSGKEQIGGLVGINAVSGVVENCSVEGSISGSHFVGGIAGKNSGVIRGCENLAQINTTAQQNNVALSDITMESLTTSEASNTVTDIGGIAGNSAGVIRSCINRGEVGYRHMGYNIGGIAGTQSGYVVDCQNFAAIMGRKEIGGIVGQMEPTARIEYKEDTLQILERQLNAMGGIVNETAGNVQAGAYGMYAQIEALQGSVINAQDALMSLIPEEGGMPDEDTIQAAENALSGSMSDMTYTLQGMAAVTQSMVGTLSNNLHSMERQMNAMRVTLGNAEETLGGTITDVSDKDTDEDLTGKAERCKNYGSVLADMNAGGIAGAMAVENDLDHEETITVTGSNSLNFSSELRCVVKGCENKGLITAGKQNAGGIVGLQSLGLVRKCLNSGTLDGAGAEYVGGVVGQSEGYIRMSGAKCILSGGSYVGGIAGSATIATDCISLVQITEGTECVGAVLGSTKEGNQDEEVPVSGNIYLPVGKDLGAIDGISYSTVAEPAKLEDFLAKEDLPQLFRSAEICFRYENGGESRFRVVPGEEFPEEKIPSLPHKNGYVARWAGLEDADLENVLFDLVFEAEYTAFEGVLSSGAGEGKPLLLIQGGFASDAVLEIVDWEEGVPLEKGQTLLKAKSFTVSHCEYLTKLRFCIYDWEAEEQILLIRGKDGTWRQAEAEPDGSYLVAELLEGDNAVAQVQKAGIHWSIPAASVAALVVLAMLLARLVKKRKNGTPA